MADNSYSELSPLPPLCTWCRKRKPSDHSHLYDKIIEEILETKQSVSPNHNQTGRNQKPKSLNIESVYDRHPNGRQSEPVITVNQRQADDHSTMLKSSITNLSFDSNEPEELRTSQHRKSASNANVFDTKMNCRIKQFGEPSKTTASNSVKSNISKITDTRKIFSQTSKKCTSLNTSVGHGEPVLHYQSDLQTNTITQGKKSLFNQTTEMSKNVQNVESRTFLHGKMSIPGSDISNLITDYQPIERTKKLFKSSKSSGVSSSGTSKSNVSQKIRGDRSEEFEAQKIRGGHSEESEVQKMTSHSGSASKSLLETCPLCQSVFKTR